MPAPISNFIPLNRKIFKHEFWEEKRPYSRFEAWLDLLATARFDTTEGRMLIGSTIVRWNRGQLVASIRYLAQRWNWGKTKVVFFLKLLKEEGMIKTETGYETAQTVITICNYDSYNHISDKAIHLARQEQDSNKTATIQDEDKTNTDNKVNTDNKEIYRGFAHLRLFTHEYFDLIALGYTKNQVDATLDAIENFKGNKKYVSLFLTAKKWLSRDDNQVAAAPKPAAGSRILNIADAFERALGG